MRILVVGAGAVGSLFGGRLAAVASEVELVGRAAHVAAIRATGLRIEGTSPGTFHPRAVSDLGAASVPDVVLLTVKTYDLGTTVSALAQRFPSPIPILLPQNGLHLETYVSSRIRSAGWSDPAPLLVRAVNTVPATWVGVGVVRQAGDGEVVLRDPTVVHPSAASASIFRDLLLRAGIRVRVVPDLERELWRKALVNAAINPVTAIHRIANGRLLDLPFREEAHALLREAQRAAESAGYIFSDSEADRDLDRVVRATAENRSSMLQDLERGRPTEVDAISGELVRTAAAHAVDLPATRAVLARLGSSRDVTAGRAQPS